MTTANPQTPIEKLRAANEMLFDAMDKANVGEISAKELKKKKLRASALP